MLSSCLWGSEERKKDENQNRTQEKRNYISFNSKTFSPAGSRATTATRVTTTTTTWEATSQEKDVFGSALWFGSATVVVVVCCCCCCCCCRSVCCLLVRISKSFIIILWHWECRPALPHPRSLLVLVSNTLIKTLNRSLIYVGIGIRVLYLCTCVCLCVCAYRAYY